MWKNDGSGAGPQRMTEALEDYEDAVREFSTNAAEFLKQVQFLTRAREAYQRATIASTQLREILDQGDETLQRFMAQLQETISLPQGSVSRKRVRSLNQPNRLARRPTLPAYEPQICRVVATVRWTGSRQCFSTPAFALRRASLR